MSELNDKINMYFENNDFHYLYEIYKEVLLSNDKKAIQSLIEVYEYLCSINFSDILAQKGDAKQIYEENLDLLEKLENLNPQKILYKIQQAIIYDDLGFLAKDQKVKDEMFKKAINIYKKVLSKFPDNTQCLCEYGTFLINLAKTKNKTKETDLVVNLYKKGFDMYKKALTNKKEVFYKFQEWEEGLLDISKDKNKQIQELYEKEIADYNKYLNKLKKE